MPFASHTDDEEFEGAKHPGYLCFASGSRSLRMESASGAPVVWDVTNPQAITRIDYGSADSSGKFAWTHPYAARRRYAARVSGASLPEPKVAGTVPTQNIHALTDLDMVIVAPSAYSTEAMRLADMHVGSSDSLLVAVVTPEEIYNEFSSGAVDPGAIRRFFKMLYDRGN